MARVFVSAALALAVACRAPASVPSTRGSGSGLAVPGRAVVPPAADRIPPIAAPSPPSDGEPASAGTPSTTAAPESAAPRRRSAPPLAPLEGESVEAIALREADAVCAATDAASDWLEAVHGGQNVGCTVEIEPLDVGEGVEAALLIFRLVGSVGGHRRDGVAAYYVALRETDERVVAFGPVTTDESAGWSLAEIEPRPTPAVDLGGGRTSVRVALDRAEGYAEGGISDTVRRTDEARCTRRRDRWSCRLLVRSRSTTRRGRDAAADGAPHP